MYGNVLSFCSRKLQQSFKLSSFIRFSQVFFFLSLYGHLQCFIFSRKRFSQSPRSSRNAFQGISVGLWKKSFMGIFSSLSYIICCPLSRLFHWTALFSVWFQRSCPPAQVKCQSWQWPTSFPEYSLLLQERKIVSRSKRENSGNEVGQWPLNWWRHKW